MSFDPKIILSAEDRTAAAFAAVTRGLDKVGLSVGTLKGGLAGLGASLSVGAMAAFVKSTVDAVDALADVADATGSTIENISALEDVAKRTGANFETVSSALVKFNAVLKDADPSKGPGAVLKALGLELEALKRQDPAEALRQVAVALSGFADDGNKARAVQELFGKSVKEAAAFLKDLAEQGQLNAKVTTEQQQAAEKFNKELFKLQANASEAARAIVGSLVPAINKIFDDVRSLGEKASLAGLASDVRGLDAELKELQQRKVSALFAPADIDRQINEVAAKLEAAKKKFNDALGVRGSAGGGRGFINPPLVRPELEIPDAAGAAGGGAAGRAGGSAAPDPTAAARRYLESLQGQLQSAQALTAAEKLLDDIRRGSLGKVTPELEKQLKATAEQVDATKALAEAEKQRAENQKGLDDLVATIDRRDNERLEALLGASESGRLQTQRDDMLFLAEAYEQGRLGAVGSAEAMRLFAESAQAYLGTGGTVPEALDEMSQAALRAGERIQDALGDELTRLLSGEFDNIGDGFAKLIQRMLAEAAAAQIMQALFPKSAGGGGGGFDLGNILGNLLTFDGGGYTGNAPRSGGLDGKGGFLSVLHPRETVLDHTRGQSAGGQSVVIHINNTIGNVASQGDVVAGMQTVRLQILGELQRGMRYGGAMA